MKVTAYTCDICHTLVREARTVVIETPGPEPLRLTEDTCCAECEAASIRRLLNMYPGAKLISKRPRAALAKKERK